MSFFKKMYSIFNRPKPIPKPKSITPKPNELSQQIHDLRMAKEYSDIMEGVKKTCANIKHSDIVDAVKKANMQKLHEMKMQVMRDHPYCGMMVMVEPSPKRKPKFNVEVLDG